MSHGNHLAVVVALACSFSCRGAEFQSSGGGGEGAGASIGGMGAGGGGGGAPPAFVDLTIEVVRFDGTPLDGRSVLVSDAASEMVETTTTGADGKVTVTAPTFGLVTVFEDDTSNTFKLYASSVFVDPSIGSVRFVQGDGMSIGNTYTVNVQSYCGPCGKGTVEIGLSCDHQKTATLDVTTWEVAYNAYRGCPGADTMEAYLVNYDPEGIPIAFAMGTGPLQDGIFNTEEGDTVMPDNLTSIGMSVEGFLNGYTVDRSVDVVDEDGIGHFRRAVETEDASLELHLVKSFVPHLTATQTVALGDTNAFISRTQRFDPFDGQSTMLDVASLAVPEAPSEPSFATPGQPRIAWALGNGPIGDVVVLQLDDTEIEWTVTLPAAATGEVLLPKLPSELSQYAIVGPPFGANIIHVDRANVEGIAAYASGGLAVVTPFEIDDQTASAVLENFQ
ncbi:MAG: hypothetical protein HOW73_00655 [Polyangiaceae bacterium]|nr:hypothetical protein [Polyangiaceae bacterium]